MPTISFDDFKKCDLRIGKILSAEPVEGSEKLLKLTVDFGLKTAPVVPEGGPVTENPELEIRQIVSGIAKAYPPETLVGKECAFILNLEPRKLMGLESQGMILATDAAGLPVLLHPDKEVAPGASIH